MGLRSPDPLPDDAAGPGPSPTPTGAAGALAAAEAASPDPPAPPDWRALPSFGADGRPLLYLTFDDGPVPRTTQPILDLLDANGAKATFFVLGYNVKKYPGLIRDTLSRGHAIANHSWDHTRLVGLRPDQVLTQISRNDAAVLAAAGDLVRGGNRPRFLRPPFGAEDDSVRELAAGLGYGTILWTLDAKDWQQPDASVIVDRIMRGAHPGAVVLLHDAGGGRAQTIRALELVLPKLREAGYNLCAITEPTASTASLPPAER
jgi:peptidoglycan/xylan/chitin deacetylase (PgdA/CDA1 family)